MKRILVTGGAGFVGSNFIIYMLKQHDDVAILNLDALTYCGNLKNLVEVENNSRYSFIRADITDRKMMEKVFCENDFDWVVNFAAESHVDRAILDPNVFVTTNVLGTATLLSSARRVWEESGAWKEGVKFLQVSTDEVYGSLGPTGLFTEKTPLDPHSPYSAAKASADLLVKSYADTFGMPVNITRCSNNYGPFQFPEKLIPLMINNCLSHKDLPVYGDGLQVRDWLYVDDHCRALDLVLRNGAPGQTYNIGGNNERTNIDIVKLIIKHIADNADAGVGEHLIKHVDDRKGHDRRYGIDPTKIQNELGWLPETVFDKGIKLTIDWYLAHREWTKEIVSGEYEKYYELQYGGR
ncbi:MAG: dTDP-glucose 4,6-dehydratase [Oscillospiraceae bacterium]|nr:dTDP-glucose 4,6-dehydratase [Oscillospiraceae bacterium]